MSTERPDGQGTPANGPARTSGPPSGPMAGRLTLAASLGGPIIAAVSYGVTRVGYEEYFAPLGLTPDVVGLGQAAIVSRPAVAVGVVAFAVTTWFGVGAISYRLIAPIALRQENEATTSFAWVKLLGLAVGLFLAGVLLPTIMLGLLLGGGPGPALWVGGALNVGAVGFFFACISPAWKPFNWLSTRRSLVALASFVVLGALLFMGTLDFWAAAGHAGRVVRSKGVLSPDVDYLAVTVAPVRVIPKDGDPLGVCDGSRRSVLVGRNDGAAFVLFLPDEESATPTEVLRLEATDYGVATGASEPQTCSFAPST